MSDGMISLFAKHDKILVLFFKLKIYIILKKTK